MSPRTIKRLRKKLGLSQARFAHKIGYSAITVSFWETGRMKPGPDAVVAMRNVVPAKI
jgi:DNA-binding transcriptional regulator YiaG